MNGKDIVNTHWLKKAAIYVALLGFFTVRCFAGLGLPPVIAVQPLGLSVQKGGTAIITMTAVSLTSMTITWQKNGHPLSNPNVLNVGGIAGTVSTLTIQSCGNGDQGAYSAVVQNGVGSITTSNANLIILEDTITDVLTNVTVLASGMTQNGFQLNLLKPATSNCVIEASTDLLNWAPIATNSSASTNITFTDSAAMGFNHRYYRTRLQ